MKLYKQYDSMDCGPTCLRMVATHYGRSYSPQMLRNLTQIGREGVSLLGIAEAAERIGFRTKAVKVEMERLTREAHLPVILHWNQNHFVVLYKIKRAPLTGQSSGRGDIYYVADPAKGLVRYTGEEFAKQWLSTINQSREKGIVLLLSPTPSFFETNEFAGTKTPALGWGFLYRYLLEHKQFFLQVFLSLIVISMLQLIAPFLTQSIVDVGINTQNLQYITLILAGQIFIILGRTVTDFIRSRLLLFIGTRINLNILSDFWIKLMKLPVSYFDTKNTGDILQRLGDNGRIQTFLTGSTISFLFSIINLLVFSVILLSFNSIIFMVFLAGSIMYFLWIRFFLSYRRKLDTQRFSLASRENSTTMQLIHGMQEIRLNNYDMVKRWEWESLQASLFKLSFRSLSLSQKQQAGAVFINETKNMVITFFVARSVIEGSLTLGAMLAVQYILGQLNSPVEQLIGFMQQAQDAKLSLERLNEIHSMENEEPDDGSLNKSLPVNKTISLNNLSFTYAGAGNEPVLHNINLEIPGGKTTAIVGTSGSGKTTLLKILLKFYDHYKGDIRIGDSSLRYISPRYWRDQCSSVMQDGFIFSDTIANNIALSGERPDYDRLVEACRMANILSFIENLPLGFNTKIGAEGTGVSQGQKQRILIARAVYKNPGFIFFDEATNSLDANNEKEILENLKDFLTGKTVVVVAHRLSTVRNADKIVVLRNGEIVEEGTHEELTLQQGNYYELVKNQLELGK